MDERPDEIEEHIHRTRGDLNENLNELEERVKTALDWRTQFQERPMTMVGLAVGGGMLLSALLPSGRRRRRYTDYDKSSARYNRRADERASRFGESRFREEDRKSNGGSLNAIRGALLTVAASKIGGVISDFLSGYREELQKGRYSHRYSPESETSTRTH